MVDMEDMADMADTEAMVVKPVLNKISLIG